MDDLVQFLRERLDEDAALAEAASPGPWHVNAESDEVLAVDDITVADGFALSGRQLRATTEHVARHDPARVLAEVASKRRIVFLAERLPKLTASTDLFDNHRDAWAEVLKRLALPYADHPAFKPEWRG